MGGLEPLEFAKLWGGTLSAEGEKKGLFLEALLGGGKGRLRTMTAVGMLNCNHFLCVITGALSEES